MLFTELRFLFFFAAVAVVYWSLRWNKARKVFLLVASYAFYAGWDWRFLGLILFSTVIDWIAGAGIHRNVGKRRVQRAWLSLSLFGNLGFLATFKYFDFCSETAQDFLRWLGFNTSLPVLNLLLPVGISFYTFQTLSYSLDIYFGKLKPARSFLDLALFVGFFPQLVAGPVVLAKEFLGQLESRRTLAHVPVRWALILFFVGFIKKACFSDYLAPFVQSVHEAPGAVDSYAAWVSGFSFAAQMYCDFSGYTDMAIACAALLGFKLPKNFAAPYLSESIGDFWRRWHITLGRWFAQYLYIPLGGSRNGKWRELRNLWIVFLVSGLWHGAGLPFIVWGAIHGTAIVAERLWTGGWLLRIPVVARIAYVNLIWIVSLVFFRSPTMQGAVELLRTMLTGGPEQVPGGAELASVPQWVVPALLGAFAVHVIWQKAHLERRWAELPPPVFGALLGAAVALAIPWINTNPAPYIYFVF